MIRGREGVGVREAMSLMWDLCAPVQKVKVNTNVWGDENGVGMVSPLNINPVIPGREMLIT